MEPKIISQRKVYDSRWLNVFEVEAETAGHRHTWTYCSRNKQPYLNRFPDAVIIVPFVRLEGETHIIMTSEYRVPVGDREWGFPAGLVDDGEDVEETARRELAEETGYKLVRVLKKSPARLYSSAGFTDETTQFVFVEAEPDGEARAEDGEDIETVVLDMPKFRELMDSGPIMSAKVWPVCNMYVEAGRFPLD